MAVEAVDSVLPLSRDTPVFITACDARCEGESFLCCFMIYDMFYDVIYVCDVIYDVFYDVFCDRWEGICRENKKFRAK